MKKYHSDSKSYNAIVEAMQQIRQNALAEEYGEDEMEEAYMYEAEGEEEEMSEMSDEEEQMVAEMMDEALYEMDMEDDEDNLNEADDGRKARRRKRLRQALLIGAGLAAAGGLGAAYTAGRGARADVDPGLRKAMPGGLAGIATDIQTGVGMGRRAAGRAVSGGIDAAGKRINYAKEYNRLVRGKQGLA
jgi:hypothetical protein